MTKHSFSAHSPQLRTLSWFLQKPDSRLVRERSAKNVSKKCVKRDKVAPFSLE